MEKQPLFKERGPKKEVEVLMVIQLGVAEVARRKVTGDEGTLTNISEGVIEDAAQGIGYVLGAVIEGVVGAIIPVVEQLIPAIIRSIEAGFKAVRESVKGSEADIITIMTIVIIFIGSFVTARGILSRGTMTGMAPPAPSVPVVGAVPL
jgi:hypothetical protein